MPDQLIVTAASPAYAGALLALIGSLDLNWPAHPPVRVYDLGLEDETLAALASVGVDVVEVPPFVPHWRKHFTWKIWAWNDAPARDVLWIDAGIVVLKPLPELLVALDRLGYFVVPSYHPLTENASAASCEGCGVDPSFREGKMTIAATIAGFRKEGVVGDVVREALEVASVERYIEATEPLHRHDQAVLSLLMYRHLGEPLFADGLVYFGWESPRQTPEQKVWVHRRSLTPADQAHFAAHIGASGPPHMPAVPEPPTAPQPTLRDHAAHLLGRVRGGQAESGVPGVTAPYDGIRD